MANLKALKIRIKSVKSTQKITKAMKMVAASKLKRAQTAAENSRPYCAKMEEILQSVAGSFKDSDNAPELLTGRKDGNRHLLVVLTSDRGLCGGFNGNIVKGARAKIKELESKGKEIKILAVGRKAIDLLKTQHGSKIIERISGINKKSVDYSEAENIAKKIIQLFETNQIDSCGLFYNKFKSVISLVTTYQQLIPLELPANDNANPVAYEYEPGEKEILSTLLPQNLAVQVFHAMLENAASEQAARMTAMENATKNAGEMIKGLTLDYNRSRQAAITKELIEIISGAEAV